MRFASRPRAGAPVQPGRSPSPRRSPITAAAVASAHAEARYRPGAGQQAAAAFAAAVRALLGALPARANRSG